MGAFSSKPTKASSPVQEISAIDRAVLDLKNSRDRLQRYRKKLEVDDEKLLLQAKKAKEAGKNEKALGILRLRKYKKAQASACEDQLLNVLQMVETIDSKQNESKVLSALASGKDTLKKMHEETTVEDVLELMDSVAEEIAVEREINEILQNVPTLSPADEEAVEAELQALQDELVAAGAAGNATALPSLPVVPTGTPLPVAPNTKLPTPGEKTTTTTTTVPQKEERVALPS
jgi:charged multivesicular body protein 6